jgi:hypothetical protein
MIPQKQKIKKNNNNPAICRAALLCAAYRSRGVKLNIL